MSMTPEKMAFIRGAGKQSAAEPAPSEAEEEKTIELREPAVKVEEAADSKSRSTPRRPSSRGRVSREQPEASEILDQVLVPVTIRLSHRTAQALRRAYLEQRLRHAKPDTQQEIVEEALGDWLSRQGFLD
jgi:hypothetical protein